MPGAKPLDGRTLPRAIHPIVNGFACPSCAPFSLREQFVHDDDNGQRVTETLTGQGVDENVSLVKGESGTDGRSSASSTGSG
jgi:hypothetical protein